MLAFHCILQQLVGKQIFEPMKPGTHYSVPLGSKITFVEVEPLAQFSTGKMIPRLLISQGQRVLPAHANFRRHSFSALSQFPLHSQQAVGFLPPSRLNVCRKIKGCKKGIWGARITQSDPHSGSRVSRRRRVVRIRGRPINMRMGLSNPGKGRCRWL